MLPRPDDADIATAPSVPEGMRGWQTSHPRATFAEIEGEATRRVAA